MGRIRSLKPEFGHHDKLSALSAEIHLFAALLLTYADDEGYFQAHPKLLHAAVCPLRELLVSIPEILGRLHEIGYVELFTGSDGREYGKVSNFLTHQRVAHPTASKIGPLMKPPESFVSSPESGRPDLGTGNGEVGTRNREGISDEQHPLNHARRMVEVLGLSERILRSVEAGLMAECGLTGCGLSETAQFIVNHATTDRQKGVPIDKFYFDDTKWRNGNGQSKPSASAARSERSKTNILNGIAKDISRRDAPVGPELKIGTGK